MLSVQHSERLQQCQSNPTPPHWKNPFPAPAWCEKSRNKWVSGSSCSGKWFKGSESVKCWVCVPQDEEGQPCARPVIPELRGHPRMRLPPSSWGCLINSALLALCPSSLQPAKITEFSPWIVIFFLFFFQLLRLEQWIFTDGVTDVNPLRICWVFCLSLNVLFKYSCAVLESVWPDARRSRIYKPAPSCWMCCN